jgi:hypothetical protein
MRALITYGSERSSLPWGVVHVLLPATCSFLEVAP